MAIHVALRHRTRYDYDRPVSLSPHVIRLRPAPHCRTPILSYSLGLVPKQHFINWQQDPFGNYLARVVFPEPTRQLVVDVELVAEMAVLNPFDFFLEPSAEMFPFTYDETLAKELTPFLEKLPVTPKLREFVAAVDTKRQRTVDFLVALNTQVSRAVKYIIRLEPGVQTPEETLTLGSGSCRDSAWLLVQTLPPSGSGRALRLGLSDSAQAGRQGARWPKRHRRRLHRPSRLDRGLSARRRLDWTRSDIGASRRRGPHPACRDAGPAERRAGHGRRRRVRSRHSHTKCRYGASTNRRASPSPTPMNNGSGSKSSATTSTPMLKAGDVRLTMGGEPTFVSIDDMDGAEWNFTALGDDKRRLAGALVRRLKDRFAPGALLHFGQGKWYPGESLPRWALGCCWRRDGVPSGTTRRSSRTTRSTTAMATPTREQVHHRAGGRAWRRRRACHPRLRGCLVLPAGRAPAAGERRSVQVAAEERRRSSPPGARLRAGARQGRRLRAADQAPRRVAREHWVSGPWFVRPEHLFLIPGDSPIGYRLPLDSLPWTAPKEAETMFDVDPFARREPLAARQPVPQRQLAVRADARGSGTQPAAGDCHATAGSADVSASGVIRTALCVEAREGRLHVFMPPVATTEDYLDLVAKVEETAGDSACRCSSRARRRAGSAAQQPKVTPDPGVIEVNLQPASDWAATRRAHDHAVRGSAPDAAGNREVHARRPPHRHRRRQPHRPRRRHGRRQPVPAPARSAAQPARLLAQSPVAVVPVLRTLLRADQSASAGRRGPQRLAPRARDRVRAGSRRERVARRGSSIAFSATCSST